MGAIESNGERAQDPAGGRLHARRAAAAVATRWVAGGIALLLLVWALAWLAVPPLVRWGLERWGSGFAGRAVTVGKVDFRPWTLELTVHDIALAAAAPGALAQAEIRRLYIDMEMQSLVRWAPVLDALEIDAPRLRVVRGKDGRYDIDDLLQLGAGRPGGGEGGGGRFALYNLALRDGAVEFTDRTTDQTHRLTGLELGIPFLSNLPADRQVTVTPRLAFSLDGSTFDTGARSTPFSEDRNTQARLRIRGLDLSPLRAYWPAGVPLRPQAGTLEAELDIGFLQGPEPRLTVGGHARLSGVRLEGPPGSAPVAFESLDVHAASVEPLRRSAHLASVEWSGPEIAVRRDAQGQWDWAAAAGAGGAQGAPRATPAASGAGPSSGAWHVAIDRVAVREGRLAWRDERAERPVAMAWDGVHAQAQSLSWPWKDGIPFRLQARMQPAAHGASSRPGASAAGEAPATLRVAGTAWPGRGQVAASLRGLPLSAVDGYAAGAFAPRAGAVIEADAGVAWNHDNGALVAKVARFVADGVTLVCPAGGSCAAPSAEAGRTPEGLGTPPGAWVQAERLEIENAWIDVPARAVSVERAVARAPRLRAERDVQGRWMFDAWLRQGEADRAPPREARSAGGDAPWSVRVGEVAVERGAVALRDAVPASPVDLRWSAIALQARGLRWPQAAGGPAVPVQLSLSGQWEAGRREPGRLAYEGRLTMAPLAVQGRLQAQQLPLHLLEPYAAPWLNVRIVRAEAGFEGDVDYAATAAGAKASVRGNAALDEVRVRAPAPAPAPAPEAGAGTPPAQPRGEELLRWRNLALQGVQWEMSPGAPARVDVRETALRDFFARIVLQKNGRLNLQDLVRSPEASSRPEPVPGQAAASGAAAARLAAADGTAADPATPATQAAVASRAGSVLRFGPMVLSAGAVRFTDYFIEPNYSADLGDLAGRIGAFSSEPPPRGGEPAMAELELSGKVQGSAPLEISGRINPLAKPLALDIQGRVRDLELPPLSPYAIKYAGHGIERGKLSMEVRYKVQPDGQLTAGNRLVLHQLTFSDPVEGASASLPVRLAAALLADSNGVIDLDLPISGSLNDPQFSLGPVILRAVGSLVLKAVTSPFSLLAKAFAGGTAEQGAVAFAPGSAVLDAAALQGLDKVAQSLRDRPALQLTVTGHAVAQAEEDGWKRERLRSQVHAWQQRRQPAARADADVQGAPAAPGGTDAAQAQAYADALRELYRRADIPKPRNLLGMARDIPVPEMEALLLAQMKVPEGALRELAQARAVAVRDELARRGVPLERLFVAAPRVDARREVAAPQAELALSAR